MAFLGSIGKWVNRNVPGVKTVADIGRGLSYGLVSGAGKALASNLSQSHGVQQIHEQAAQPASYYYMQPYPYSGGGYSGGYANAGEPITPYYEGGQQWGSSIPLTTYSVQPSPTYQAYSPPTQGGDRIWEDLILGSSLFL